MVQEIPIAEQPVVTSDRFILRALRTSDAGLITHYASEKRVATMTSNLPHPYPPGAAQGYIDRMCAPERIEDAWAMDGTSAESPELMGVISLKRMDRNQSEVGYWVAPPFWNTGLASEAVHALVLANPLRNKTMFASVFQDNPASGRVLTHCGFEYIGDAESFSIARNTTVPTWTYLKRMG